MLRRIWAGFVRSWRADLAHSESLFGPVRSWRFWQPVALIKNEERREITLAFNFNAIVGILAISGLIIMFMKLL